MQYKDLNTEHFLKQIKGAFFSSHYYSVNDFCERNPQFQPADVSRFLSGKKNWTYQKVFLLMALLKIRIEFWNFESMLQAYTSGIIFK